MGFLYTAYSLEGSAECVDHRVSVEYVAGSETAMMYLQQFSKKRNKVCPFVCTIKRGETLFDLLGIFLVFRIRREGCTRPWKDARECVNEVKSGQWQVRSRLTHSRGYPCWSTT